MAYARVRAKAVGKNTHQDSQHSHGHCKCEGTRHPDKTRLSGGKARQHEPGREAGYHPLDDQHEIAPENTQP